MKNLAELEPDPDAGIHAASLPESSCPHDTVGARASTVE